MCREKIKREKERNTITLEDRFVVIRFCLVETAVELQSSDPSSELDCHCFLTLFHFKRLLSFQISLAMPQALTLKIDGVVFAVFSHSANPLGIIFRRSKRRIVFQSRLFYTV